MDESEHAKLLVTLRSKGDAHTDKMRGELKSIYAPNFDLSLHEVVQPDPEKFEIHVGAFAGPEGE